MAGITVNVRCTDGFKEILNVMEEFIKDERVPAEVKQEFKNKIISIVNKS